MSAKANRSRYALMFIYERTRWSLVNELGDQCLCRLCSGLWEVLLVSLRLSEVKGKCSLTKHLHKFSVFT